MNDVQVLSSRHPSNFYVLMAMVDGDWHVIVDRLYKESDLGEIAADVLEARQNALKPVAVDLTAVFPLMEMGESDLARMQDALSDDDDEMRGWPQWMLN